MENSAPVPACLTAARLLSGLLAVARKVCADFTAYDRLNDVYTDERGEPGLDRADVRHGAAKLFDETDVTNGAFYWISTLMPRRAQGLEHAPYPFSVAGHVSMPTGDLEPFRCRRSRGQPLQGASERDFRLSGRWGTGVFAGALGEMETSTVIGEDRLTLRFTLTWIG